MTEEIRIEADEPRVRALAMFSAADLARVREAVAKAEQRTAGELVTYLVGECDTYPEATLRAALFGALAAPFVAAVLTSGLPGTYIESWGDPMWTSPLVAWLVLPAAFGALFSALVVHCLPSLRRLLVTRAALERRVALRAESAFLEEEVFATRDRTGILIFLALFERRALILGDEGIDERVKPEEWHAIVQRLVTGMRSSDPTGALIHAIEECGELLERRELVPREDDVDELSDSPRVRQR